jgi:hypothetical protein
MDFRDHAFTERFLTARIAAFVLSRAADTEACANLAVLAAGPGIVHRILRSPGVLNSLAFVEMTTIGCRGCELDWLAHLVEPLNAVSFTIGSAPLHGWGTNPYNGMFPELSAVAGTNPGG